MIKARRLDEPREPPQFWMIDQRCEPTAADASLADVLVPVDARAEGPLRIVEMQGAQMFQAHSMIEGAQHLVDTLGGAV